MSEVQVHPSRYFPLKNGITLYLKSSGADLCCLESTLKNLYDITLFFFNIVNILKCPIRYL